MTPVSAALPAPAAAAPSPRSSRFRSLDGLRIVAIGMVVISHAQHTVGFPKWLARWWPLEGMGVMIFLVLSGFVVTRQLLSLERRHGTIPFRQFYERRWLRLLPPIAVFVAVCIGIKLAGLVDFSAKELIASLTFTRNLVHGHYYTGHLWSLGVQEQFYLVWPALLLVTPSGRRLEMALALLVLQPVWAAVSPRFLGPPDEALARPDLRMLPLLLGATLALAHQRVGSGAFLRGPVFRNLASFLIGIGLLAFERMVLPYLGLPGGATLGRLCEYLGIALLVNHLAAAESSLAVRFLELPVMVWLGQQAFQIYIWQQLFAANGGWWCQTFPLNIGLLLLVTLLTFYCVEQPVLRWRDRRAQKPGELATGPG